MPSPGVPGLETFVKEQLTPQLGTGPFRYFPCREAFEAKQAACDIISFGHVGTGNMDSIMNMNPEDQVLALAGAVHHSELIDAGVKQMKAQMAPATQPILEGKEKFSPPQINASEITEQAPSLPEVKYDIPKEKIRLQSSNKSED